MFKVTIGSVPVVFSKFFSPADSVAVLAAIHARAHNVLFVDTGATPELVTTIKSLVERGVNVYVRDHHKGEGRNPECTETIEQLLGEDALIVDRKSAPGCSQIIKLGAFDSVDCIVADPDYDGLVAAMKALGYTYEGMDNDAEVFDVRPKQSAESLTPVGWLAVRALSTLPAFDKDKPETSEYAKCELFETFVKATAFRKESSLKELEKRVEAYEAGVAEAKRLLHSEKMSSPCKGVRLVDTIGASLYDLSTLARGMEFQGVFVTVVRKNFGPIAGKHGVQYSLASTNTQQEGELDLRTLVPTGTETSPQAGLISNTSFLLHCSEKVWNETILPALQARLA